MNAIKKEPETESLILQEVEKPFRLLFPEFQTIQTVVDSDSYVSFLVFLKDKTATVYEIRRHHSDNQNVLKIKTDVVTKNGKGTETQSLGWMTGCKADSIVEIFENKIARLWDMRQLQQAFIIKEWARPAKRLFEWTRHNPLLRTFGGDVPLSMLPQPLNEVTL